MPGNQPVDVSKPKRTEQQQRRQDMKDKRLTHLNDRKKHMNDMFDARIAQVEAEQID